MIKIAICDDHPEELSEIANSLISYRFKNKATHSVECFQDSVSLLNAVENHAQFDILILDIIIPNMDGIALAKSLRALGNESAIIFLTISPDYALKSYAVNAFQYLLKPLNKKQLFDVLDQIEEKLIFKQDQRLVITTVQGIQNIRPYDITFVEHINHVLYVHMKDGTVLITANSTMTLGDLEKKLNHSDFLRPHRAFIVNLYVVRTLSSDSFILENDACVPIARRRYTAIKEAYLNFLLHIKRGIIL